MHALHSSFPPPSLPSSSSSFLLSNLHTSYILQQYSCQYNDKYRGATATGVVSVSSGDENSLLNAVASSGPVATSIDASHSSFQVTT